MRCLRLVLLKVAWLFHLIKFSSSQGYSVNFQQRSDAESCHMFCGKNEDCEWWSFEPSQSMCIAFENCTESGNPDNGACPDCISGERLCPARKCHDPKKCKGHFAGSFETAHLEDCIRGCNDNPSCSFYTFEKSNDHCLLYKDRGACKPCDTCASGEKRCSIGYHGTDSSAFMTPATSSEPEAPSTTIVTLRIDGTTPVCQIAQRIDGAYAECSEKCGQPLIASDYFSYSKNWKCYRDCGLPKLGYEPGHAGQTEAYNRLTMSAYWPAISDGFRADRRAYGDDADMGKSAVEFFAEKCEEAKYYLANYGVRR